MSTAPRNGLATKHAPYVQSSHGNVLHGFYFDMPYEEYAKIDALNASKIVNMRRSPMYYEYMRDNPAPSTPAQFAGTVTHQLILEPHLENRFAVWGRGDDQKVRRGKVWDAFAKEHEDDIILTVAEHDEVLGMACAALRNVPIRNYATAKGPTEVSMFWRHPVTDRRMKARIDKLISETHTIFDLKTTFDCHSWRFGGTAYRLGYHLKISHYAQGYQILTGHKPQCRLGALDSKPPHECAVYRVTDEVLAMAHEELQTLYYRIEECEKKKNWPGEYDQETDLILPSYAGVDSFETEDTMQ